MRQNPLSPRVLVLSWAAALLAWPFTWLLLAVAQGLGTRVAGGSWIGVAVPLGLHPWGVVNEPSIAFANTEASLFLYWLPPQLVALAVALLLPTLAPVPPSWRSEAFVFQLATASAVLGLGWAPPLGIADGPAAGLARFWEISPTVFVSVSAAVGAFVVQIPGMRMASRLWVEPGGPTRRRRLLVALGHAFVPAVGWGCAVIALGWRFPLEAVVTAGAVLLGTLVGAWLWVPRAPLRPRPEVGWGNAVAVAVLGIAAFAGALWAGAPRGGGGRAIVWGEAGQTANLRPGVEVVRLTMHPAPKKPPARSAP
jgi:hypothetical protein